MASSANKRRFKLSIAGATCWLLYIGRWKALSRRVAPLGTPPLAPNPPPCTPTLPDSRRESRDAERVDEGCCSAKNLRKEAMIRGCPSETMFETECGRFPFKSVCSKKLTWDSRGKGRQGV